MVSSAGRLSDGLATLLFHQQEKELAEDRQQTVVGSQPTSNSEPAGVGN